MLIVAPTPLLAANFVMMGRIVRRLGVKYSRLSPRLCESVPTLTKGVNVDEYYPDTIVFASTVSRVRPAARVEKLIDRLGRHFPPCPRWWWRRRCRCRHA